jgi:peptidoglycan/LPS O-acetylase OafA/YrhL
MKRIDSLTSLRFFAALGVLLHHAGFVFFPGMGARSTFLGFTGVTFFFVLSGFVLTWSYRPGTAWQFYRRRIARVYPLHVVTWVAATIVGALLAVQGFNLIPWITGLFLVQAWIPSQTFYFAGNGPAWSLSCEAFFYAVFPFAIVWATRRRFRTLIACLAALALVYVAAVVVFAVTGVGGFTLLYINPAGRFIDFAVGIVVALAARAGLRSPIPLSAAVALVLVYLVGVGSFLAVHGTGLFTGRFVADAIMLPLAGLVVWSASTRTEERLSHVLSAPVMIRLGEWSFAMYLVQSILLLPLEVLMGQQHWSAAGRAAGEVAFIGATIALAALAYHWIERPFERYLRGARPRPEMQAAART